MSSYEGAGAYAPYVTITDTDHGGYVTEATFTFLVVMILVVVARITYRFQMVSKLKLDDYFLILACGFAILQSVFVQLAIDHGLGRHRSSLAASSLEAYEKFNYASQILLVVVLVFSKISLLCLLESLRPSKSIRVACRCTEAFVALWGLAAVVALALQCPHPRPWQDQPGKCIDQGALYTADAIINIVTEIIIMSLPVLVMYSVQTSFKKRALVVGLFLPRILVVAATIGRLIVLQSSYLRSSDRTWDNVTLSIWNQAMINLSIILACLPSLRSFLVQLQPNKIGMTIPDAVELASMSRFGVHMSSSDGSRRIGRQHSARRYIYGGHSAHITSTITSHQERRPPEPITRDGTESTKALRAKQIFQTSEFTVEYEGEPKAAEEASGKSF